MTNLVSKDWPLILAYHSVSRYRSDALAVNVREFERQMKSLYSRRYRAVTLAQYTTQQFQKGERIVIITFDGYADNCTVAFPILKRYGFNATIFLVSDYIGTDRILPVDMPKINKASENSWYKHLNLRQIGEMSEYGIEFGSHTCTHPLEMTRLSQNQCWDEINRSRKDLKRLLGNDIVSFCYPRGNLDSNIIKMVEKAGYSCAVVTPPRSGIPLNRYTLRRIGIYYRNTPLHFRLKTTRLARRNYERYKWICGKR